MDQEHAGLGTLLYGIEPEFHVQVGLHHPPTVDEDVLPVGNGRRHHRRGPRDALPAPTSTFDVRTERRRLVAVPPAHPF